MILEFHASAVPLLYAAALRCTVIILILLLFLLSTAIELFSSP